jgi:hypothetical protein
MLRLVWERLLVFECQQLLLVNKNYRNTYFLINKYWYLNTDKHQHSRVAKQGLRRIASCFFFGWLRDDAVGETGELPRSKRKRTFAITPSEGTSISGGKLQACLCEANMHRA